MRKAEHIKIIRELKSKHREEITQLQNKLAYANTRHYVRDFKVVLSNKTRPEQAPVGWVVFNAPRPLYGTLVNDKATVWTNTKGPTGYHFAAVDPLDSWASKWIDFNRINDAVIVEYTTLEVADNG